MKIKLLILIVLIVLFAFSCKFDLPTGPDEPGDIQNSEQAVKSIWSSYINVFPFGIQENSQQPHLLKLINAGMLRGVRLGALDTPLVQSFARWFQSYGVDVLGLFDNKYLKKSNVCQIFAEHVRENPGVINWEIGNEVNYIDISPEEYVEVVKKLFHYVKENNLGVKIVSGGVGGNVAAADSLRRMIDAGLDRLCQEGLEIVAIHFYSWQSFTRIAEFKSQIERLPAHVRIFITETNTMPPSWDNQISYVKRMYPQLRNSLRAERIYWFAFSGKGDFSLVMANNWKYSPLMKVLIRTTSNSQSISRFHNFNDFSNDFFEPPRFPNRQNRKNKKIKQERKRK